MKKAEVIDYLKKQVAPDLGVPPARVDENANLFDDLYLDGDDFSDLAIRVEEELRIRPVRKSYEMVSTISDWATLIVDELGECFE